MFDTVFVPCPHCGKVTHEQSKGGDCCFGTYDLMSATLDVLRGLDAVIECRHCGKLLSVDVTETNDEVRIVVRKAGARDVVPKPRVVIIEGAQP